MDQNGLLQIIKKALVLDHFGASEKADQITLSNLSNFDHFGAQNAKWHPE